LYNEDIERLSRLSRASGSMSSDELIVLRDMILKALKVRRKEGKDTQLKRSLDMVNLSLSVSFQSNNVTN